MACPKCQALRESTKAQVVCCNECASKVEKELVSLLMEMSLGAMVLPDDDDDEVIH